jgi:hypothetical protein
MINKYRIDWLLMEQTTDDFNTVCNSIYTKIQTLLYIPIGIVCWPVKEYRDRQRFDFKQNGKDKRKKEKHRLLGVAQ